MFSIADFVRSYLALQGPAAAISTACSSSAKVFASAHRLMEAGLADAAVVGGVDSLCLTTLYGFASLELLSREPCRPCDAARKASRSAKRRATRCWSGQRRCGGVALLGGESDDAYHMSSPHPEGEGAYMERRAMQRDGWSLPT